MIINFAFAILAVVIVSVMVLVIYYASSSPSPSPAPAPGSPAPAPAPAPAPSTGGVIANTMSGSIIINLDSDEKRSLPMLGSNVDSWYQIQKPCRFGELVCVLNGNIDKASVVECSPTPVIKPQCKTTRWNLIRIGNLSGNSNYTSEYTLVFPSITKENVVVWFDPSDTTNWKYVSVDYKGLLVPTASIVDPASAQDYDYIYYFGNIDDIKPGITDTTDPYDSMVNFLAKYIYDSTNTKGGLGQIIEQSVNLYKNGCINQIVSNFGIPTCFTAADKKLKNLPNIVDRLAFWMAGSIKLFIDSGVHVPYTELLNEPDGNWAQLLKVTQYFDMVVAIKSYFKEYNITNTKILGPGLSRIQCVPVWDKIDPYPYLPNLEDYLTVMNDTYGNILDGISSHTWEDSCLKDAGPEHIVNSINSMIAMRDLYAPGLPIFVTEYGRNQGNTPSPIFIDTQLNYKNSLGTNTPGKSYACPEECQKDNSKCQAVCGPAPNIEQKGAQDLDPANTLYIFSVFLAIFNCNIDGLCFWDLTDIGGGYYLDNWVTYGNSFGYGLFDRLNNLKPLGKLMVQFTLSLPDNPIKMRIPNGYNMINSCITNQKKDVLIMTTCNNAAIIKTTNKDYVNTPNLPHNPGNQYLSYRVKGNFYIDKVTFYITNYTGENPDDLGGYIRKWDNGRMVYQEFKPSQRKYTWTSTLADYISFIIDLEYDNGHTSIIYKLPPGCALILSLAKNVPNRNNPVAWNKSHCELFPQDALC